jgi:hypothetical protein
VLVTATLVVEEVNGYLSTLTTTGRAPLDAPPAGPLISDSVLLKEGDQLYDGDVVSINRAEVVFKQIVQDPTALKPFREVVKSLNPSS